MWKDEQFILYCIWCFIEAKMGYIIQCTYLKVIERYSLFYALIFTSLKSTVFIKKQLHILNTQISE